MSAFIKKTSFVGVIFSFTFIFCHQALTSERVIGPSAFLKALDEARRKRAWKKRMFLNAAAAGDIETLREFHRAGVDVEAKDPNGQRAIHIAAANDQAETLRFLVNELGANIEARDNIGETALFATIKNNKLELNALRVLINELRANVNARNNANQTILQFAAMRVESGTLLAVLIDELSNKKKTCGY